MSAANLAGCWMFRHRRAGRDGTRFNVGYATCLYPDDMNYFHQAMSKPHEPLTQAGLVPSLEQVSGSRVPAAARAKRFVSEMHGVAQFVANTLNPVMTA